MSQAHDSLPLEGLLSEARTLSPAELRAARRFAVQFAYGADLQQVGNFSEWGFLAFLDQMQVPSNQRGFLRALCELVMSHLGQIDGLIQTHCHNWKLARVGKVDLAVLRVCTGELLFRSDTASEVILADAAEIGRELGSGGSSAFVNGVLDAVSKASRPKAP